MSGLIINHNVSNNDPIADSLWDAHIAKKFEYGNMFYSIKKENTFEFLDRIKKEFNVDKIFNYKYNDINVYIIETDNLFLQVDERKDFTDLYFFTRTREDHHKIFEIAFEYKYSDNEKSVDFDEYSYINGNVSVKQNVLNYDYFKDIMSDFYPFLDAEKLIEYFLYGKENLLILGGEPGTGKSKFISLIIKWMLDNNFKERPLIASAKDINLLSMDSFWSKVKSSDLLILDDLDFMLGSRDESREDVQKNNFLSKLLSFTDGFLTNKTKIVITTNQPLSEMDEALLREGRLFDILNFRYLKKHEAEKILHKFDIEYDIIENEIPQSKIGSIIENYKKINTYKRDYLKENISLIHKLNNKKAGFI